MDARKHYQDFFALGKDADPDAGVTEKGEGGVREVEVGLYFDSVSSHEHAQHIGVRISPHAE